MRVFYTLVSFFVLLNALVSASLMTSMFNPKTMNICQNQNLFGNEQFHLGFWKDVRGRANLIRMVLEFSGLKYSSHYFGASSNVGYDFSDWYGVVMPLIKLETGRSVSLPWLVDCSSGKTEFIFEVGGVLSYLLVRYNPKLLGSNETKPKVIEVSEKAQELLSLLMSVSTTSELTSEDALASSVLVLTSLRELEGLAAESMTLSSAFLFGDEPTIADFSVFELVSQLGLLASGLSNEFVFLLQSASSVASLEFMVKLMNSSRYTSKPIWPKIVNKSPYSTELDATNDFATEIRKFGEYLYWLGASLTASTSAMCLSHQVYSIARSSSAFRVGSMMKYSHLYNAGLKVTSNCPVVRFFRRITRYDVTTKNNMLRQCKVSLYSLLYSGSLLTESLIQEICSSYVTCFANRVKSRGATAVLISAAEGIQSKLCGDTCTLRAEVMFAKHLDAPSKVVKAMKLFRLSGEATVGGSILPLVVIGVINSMVNSGALSQVGYVVDKESAIKVCDESLYSRTVGRMYSEGWDRYTLCKAILGHFDDTQVNGPEEDVALAEAAVLVSVSEVMSGEFAYCEGKCEQATCEQATCEKPACEKPACSSDVPQEFSKSDISLTNYLRCKSNPSNWGKSYLCDKFNPAYAHVFGQIESKITQDVFSSCKAFYYNSMALAN